MMKLRALVVDDTSIFRKVISDAISAIPDVEVVGTASNGKIALERILSLRPDVITLDIEMPVMNGLDVLKEIRAQQIDVGVIMLSAHTRRGSDLTIQALELGAFDFLKKPSGGTLDSNIELVKRSLATLFKAYAQRREIQSILRGSISSQPAGAVKQMEAPDASPGIPSKMGRGEKISPAEIVLIGVSTGGPVALAQILPQLPPDLGVPIFIVQHMPPLFTASLAESLDDKCAIRVKEAEAEEESQPNVAYIAPGGKQMKLIKGSGRNPVIRITDDAPENNCKPSADYLFRSAAYGFPGHICAVIMTGMGADGTMGLRLIKRHSAHVIAQDEVSCVVFGMPKEAIKAGVVDAVVSLDKIPGEITEAVKGRSF